MEKHISVLLNEVINNLDIKNDGIYVDMTMGYAGHSKEVLKRIPKGYLYGFDKDPNACLHSRKLLSTIGNNFKIFNCSNDCLKEKLAEVDVKLVDGFIFDLGLSSVEIDEKERGFSYMQDALLDMRMNPNDELTARDVVNNYSIDDLVRIFREYGEEHHAYKIAKEIELSRKIKPINTTLELVDIIDRCYPYKEKRTTHPAKKVFQAIRIEVNNELESLKKALKDALDLLNVGGIICVISFHSLEDRIVKEMFKQVTTIDPVIKGMPNIDSSLLPDYELINRKPILPTTEEITFNKRAKSAKLRIIKRIK